MHCFFYLITLLRLCKTHLETRQLQHLRMNMKCTVYAMQTRSFKILPSLTDMQNQFYKATVHHYLFAFQPHFLRAKQHKNRTLGAIYPCTTSFTVLTKITPVKFKVLSKSNDFKTIKTLVQNHVNHFPRIVGCQYDSQTLNK